MRIAKLLALSALAACAERPAAPRTDIPTSSPALQRTAQPDHFDAVEMRTRRLPPSEKERALIEAAVAGLPPTTAEALRAALLDSTGTSRVYVSGSSEMSAAIAKIYEERRRSNPRPKRRALIPVTIALVPELVHERATADIIRRPGVATDWDIILLREREVSAARLDAAVFTLLRDREETGLISSTYRHVFVGFAKAPVQIPARVFDASATVHALLNAPARPLDGVGTVKAVVVNLPVVKFSNRM